MSTMNRRANANNKFQTQAKRVLCLCSAGLLRSPTTANVLHREYGHNTRAAGVTAEYALIPVDEVLVEWADEIVCVEQAVASTFLSRFSNQLEEGREKNVVVLNVPDQFEWNNPELQQIILEQYREKVL